MSRIYRPDRRRGYGSLSIPCVGCAKLAAENHDLRLKVEALSLTLDMFRKAILADYEFRGFTDAEDYINELIVEEAKREAENAREWEC